MQNGPVVTTMAVYEDFMNYGSGTYQYVTGEFIAYHAVQIVGWGQDVNSNFYWIGQNQWTTSWGDNGYFNI